MEVKTGFTICIWMISIAILFKLVDILEVLNEILFTLNAGV